MKIFSIIAATALTTIIAGCAGPAAEVAPPPTNFTIAPVSARYFVASAGSVVPAASLPTVHIQSENGSAAGVVVTFTTIGSGGRSTFSVATDKNGNAQVDSWQVGSTSGEYTATATTSSGLSLEFTAFVRTKVVAAYDAAALVYSSSVTYPPAHYVQFDDGTFIHYTGPVADNEITRAPDGKFGAIGPGVVVFTGPFPFTSVFSTGTIKGNTMQVSYANWLDYFDEVYSRRN